jgi:photosystem II stability/assembly factor-like uncharacterized protein
MNIKNSSRSTIGLFLFFGILITTLFLPCCQTTKENTRSEKIINPNGRNDAWGFIGAGGGGAMFNPAVSPHDPNMAFVSCDMTGSFVTYNGGESWRMFNLRSPVQFYVFDKLDSNVVYANSIALFKSTDRGNTWNLLYPGFSEIKGLVSKGDHGSEIVITKDSTNRQVLALAVDPGNSKKLYAAISINKSTALFISDDGGEHWQQEKELEDRIKKIFIDPSSPIDNRSIYVAGNKGISQKVNGTWKINKGPKDVASLTEFSGGYDELKKKYLIYAISGKSYFNPADDKSGIYYTDNGGMTWANRQDGLLALKLKGADIPGWRTVATCASHPEVVYVSYNGLKVHEDSTCIGVAKSEDYGKTWKLVWKDVITKAGYSPSNNFSSDWLNDRWGPSWGENPFCIGVSPANPEICFTTDFGRTIKTNNGGKTWEQVYSKRNNSGGWTSRGLEVTTGYNVVFDPFDINHVFIALTDIGQFESKDGTRSWMSATKNNGIPKEWINTCYWMKFDPEVKGKAWAVMSGTHDLPRPKMWRRNGISGYKGGILLTENGGKTWQPVSSDIGEAAMTHILIDPTSNKEARTLYACAFGKGVYKSVDGGKTWIQKNKGIAVMEPFTWQIIRRENDGVLFLIVSRRSEDGSIGNEKDGDIYKSADGAENWTKISLPDGTNAPTGLAIDKRHPNQLVLSAWGRVTKGQFTPDIGGGIFLSGDEGKTWKQVMEKDQHIGAITFDSRNNRFYACGFGGSAYYSEDGGNVWNRIKGYNFKWGQRVEPDPRDPEKIFIITFGGGIWYGPAKGDEQAVEDIIMQFK